ncbi:hypothetical protein E2562_010733 [Oryza meyeriana var. granulata]|uniref:Uncharacterized protein n=1 Tax=Oryza meyeriana var. granulata TaxID=110450 RepID=A0A6G1EW82_9ORYZ|nr:hypothetical protein E2562_010733 [Oryza meyeriana var. granulata]
METGPAAMDEWVILSDGDSDTAAVVLGGSDTASEGSSCSDIAASEYNGGESGYTAWSRPLVSPFDGVDRAPPRLIFDGPLRPVVAAAAAPQPPEFVKEVSYSYGEALSIGGGDEIKERLAASEIEATAECSKAVVDAVSQDDTICGIGNAGVVICDPDVVEHTAHVDDGNVTIDNISVVEVTDVVDHGATAHVDDGSATTDGISVDEVADVVEHTVHVNEGGISVIEVPPATVSSAAPPATSSEVDEFVADDEHESRSSPTPAVAVAPKATSPPPPPPRFSEAARFSLSVVVDEDENPPKATSPPPPRFPEAAGMSSEVDKSVVDDEGESTGSKSGDAAPTPTAVVVEVDKSVVDDEHEGTGRRPGDVLTTSPVMKDRASEPAHGGHRCRCAPLEHCRNCDPRQLVIRKEKRSPQVLNLREELAVLLKEAAVANQRLGRREGLWLQSPAAINAAFEARVRTQAFIATNNAATINTATEGRTQAHPDRPHGSGQSPAAINAASEARMRFQASHATNNAAVINAALEAPTQAPPDHPRGSGQSPAAAINAGPEALNQALPERRRGSEPSVADMADFAIAYLFSSSCMILYTFCFIFLLA